MELEKVLELDVLELEVLVELDGFVPLMNLLERQSELVSYKTSINTHDIFTA